MQESGADDILAVDTEVGIAKKATCQYQVMTWLLVACVLVVLVDHLLSKDREDHSSTSAKNKSDTRVCEVVTCHDLWLVGVAVVVIVTHLCV